MIEPNANKNIAYRPDIDGLRAIAVMSVLAYHFEPGLIRGGFVGVDIFFVISGFLISSIIYKELEAGHFSIVEFYVRRIRRIYPALVIVLVGSCIAGWAITLPSDFVLLGQQIVGGSTFVVARVQSEDKCCIELCFGRWEWKSNTTCSSRCSARCFTGPSRGGICRWRLRPWPLFR